jgi:hypothetical protein
MIGEPAWWALLGAVRPTRMCGLEREHRRDFSAADTLRQSNDWAAAHAKLGVLQVEQARSRILVAFLRLAQSIARRLNRRLVWRDFSASHNSDKPIKRLTTHTKCGLEMKDTGGVYPVAKNNKKDSGSSKLGVEAPGGFEPPHRSFADCSLSHLGTAPLVGFSLDYRRCPLQNSTAGKGVYRE